MGNKQTTLTNSRIHEWVSLYSDDLFRWSFYKTNNKETAEDLVQETFLAAVKSLDKFQGNSQPKTWLFSIMNNKIIDFHRKKFREAVINPSSINERQDGINVMENFFDSEGNWNPDTMPSTWKEMEGNLLDNMEFKEVLQHCLQRLPENWFSAIQFKYLEKKDGKEICKELGITSSNYWQILHRAKLQLRICLEKNWFKLQV